MKINELQDRLYELLQIVNSICKRNNITFWMHGGSAIGAVREHGFIPWDDDMDILILAEEYKKFRLAMNTELPYPFRLIEPQDFSPFFYDYIIRIVDDQSRLRVETEEDTAYQNYQNCVCIDVFLLSGCPKAKSKQHIWLLQYDVLYGMAMQYRFKVEYGKYDFWRKCAVATLCAVGKLYSGSSPQRIIQLWWKFVDSIDASKTETRMISNTTPHCYWRPMPDEWFHSMVYKRFRDIEVPVPKEYDDELSFIYGDYMTPIKDNDKYITHLDEESKKSSARQD